MSDSNQTILSRLQYYAQSTPNQICLIDAASGEQVTYASFWSRILRYARNVQPGR